MKACIFLKENIKIIFFYQKLPVYLFFFKWVRFLNPNSQMLSASGADDLLYVSLFVWRDMRVQNNTWFSNFEILMLRAVV
jgi:hypothetical protein